MPRQPDSARKPALLEQIIDYLLDRPLSSVSLRPLADALGVSTFTLVYHFGSRAELIGEIVGFLSQRSHEIAREAADNRGTIDSYLQGMEVSWQWSLHPRSILLLRLEFEAAMFETHETSHAHTRDVFARWQQIGYDDLIALGLGPEEAEAESRLTVDTIFGLQYDLVVNRDRERATAAFQRFVQQTRGRLESALSRR